MKKNLLRIVLCMLLVTAMIGCQLAPAGAEADKKLTFAIIYANIHPFFDAIG